METIGKCSLCVDALVNSGVICYSRILTMAAFGHRGQWLGTLGCIFSLI